jgi:tetratricopeptide (TPR) repeat protein
MFSSMSSSNSDAAAVVRGSGTANDCDLRAELGGYTSSAVNLNNPAAFNGPDVGVIWLHRTGQEGSGNLVSVFALSAPKDAKKSFDKGIDLMRTRKWGEAAESFRRAVAIYPNYADAWLGLGRVQFTMGSNDAARNSFARAVQLDAKLTGGWQSLGYLASNDRRWQDAVQYLDKAVALEPLSSPLPWFVSALANFNLGQFERAERSIREEIKLDTRSQYPRAKYLLGLILIGREDVRGGAEAIRSYLASSPEPRDVEPANTVLSRLQIASAK